MTINKFLILILSTWLTVTLHLPAHSQVKDGLSLAIAAQELYSLGKLTSAATMWQKTADAHQAQNDFLGKTKSLINKAQVLQDMGLYPKACDDLLEAFEINNPDCSSEQVDRLITRFEAKSKLSATEGIGLRSLGDVLRHKGKLEQSRTLLNFSQVATKYSAELGSTLMALGNVEKALANKTRDRWSYDKITEIIDRQDPDLALEPYKNTFLAYASTASDRQVQPITQIQSQLNYLNLLIEIESWWQRQIDRRTETWQRQQATRLIEAAANFNYLLKYRLADTRASLITAIDSSWSNIRPSHESIYARITYTRSLTKLKATAAVEPILKTALAEAVNIKDSLGESYVWGYLGKYYGQRQELTKAISFTRKALLVAQSSNSNNDAREITYLWHSQLGQLLEQQRKIPDAIAAYTSAFNTLQSLRTDLSANNKVVQFDFRQEVKPVYLNLANLLLQSDRPQALKSLELFDKTGDSNPNLESARQVIESLQLAELDNFFQDPCSETADINVTIDEIDPQAAVVYPIILSDRLEVILSLPNQPLQKFTTPVSETTVNRTIDLLYDSLYNPSVNNSAVNIFSTTILNPREVDENMQTLLPILQQINSWLIEPLTSTLSANQVQTLVFVLSGRLQNVPISALYDGQQYLLEKYGVALAPSLQLLAPQPMAKGEVKVLAAGLSQQVEVQGNIFPALNHVPSELNQIEDIFPQSRQLLDRDFTTKTIQKQLASDFSVIHLATHGLFSSNPDETFIITGDGEMININTFSNLLNSSSTNPDLVVLSACETAAGDELAILGLAGVAVRSGASSTIASLWAVDDASTAELMSRFYREFKNPQAKKVDALQKAQLSLMNSLRQNPPSPALESYPPHPYYWSPYVLVGNWQ
ncbi:MAG: CHAT domain-containing protein [Pleurocapsa sp.]